MGQNGNRRAHLGKLYHFIARLLRCVCVRAWARLSTTNAYAVRHFDRKINRQTCSRLAHYNQHHCHRILSAAQRLVAGNTWIAQSVALRACCSGSSVLHRQHHRHRKWHAQFSVLFIARAMSARKLIIFTHTDVTVTSIRNHLLISFSIHRTNHTLLCFELDKVDASHVHFSSRCDHFDNARWALVLHIHRRT